MTEQKENLQDLNNDVSITDEAPSITVDSAEGKTSEDTPTDAKQEIIDQQKSTIDALMQRTEELTKQINTLLAMGVQISDGKLTPEQTEELNNNIPDDYVTLEQLGAEFGKR